MFDVNPPWVVWKYTLRTPEDQEWRHLTTIVEMPENAIIKSIERQRNQTVMYAQVYPHLGKRLYRILILGTGQKCCIPADKCKPIPGVSMLSIPKPIEGHLEDNSVCHCYLVEETGQEATNNIALMKNLKTVLPSEDPVYWHSPIAA